MTVLFLSSAQAQKINIQILNAPNSVNTQEIKRSFNLARRLLKNAGVSITLNKIDEFADPCSEMTTLPDFLNKFLCLLERFRPGLKRQVYNYTSAPPLSQNGFLFSGGWSVATCQGNQDIRYSMGYSKIDSSVARNYTAWNAVIIAHELAHALGAYHDYRIYNTGCSIMHPSALGCVNLDKPAFSKQSIREMRACHTQLERVGHALLPYYRIDESGMIQK